MNTTKNTNTSVLKAAASSPMKVVHRSVSFGKKRNSKQSPIGGKGSNIKVVAKNKTPEISNIQLIPQLKKTKRHSLSLVLPNIMVRTRDEILLHNITNYIIDNMACPDLNVTKIMGVAHMSRTQLHRKLKSLSGLSTTAFIRCIRLEKAAYLLQQNVDNVTQIAYRTGFSDHSYFTKCFKRKYGVSPSDYIRNHKVSYLL
ncbi:helix-turn-helix domain-containing protein [Aquimarina spongiae]|uniref:AraC-type DNA-binding protein n=1 Tax=Aquimarina spongiae TaxID=570521 RepID=A0A1M6IX49_9FLAO|nr:AraC family transcriptional regulator [Aquimarina spongiae]SHJ38997.1 AraC-type DNA-binding protein [Aquimarina spongiae]